MWSLLDAPSCAFFVMKMLRLQKKGKVTLKILRAESEEVQKRVSDRVHSSKSDRSANQPSVVMKSDVIEIAQRERRRLLECNNVSKICYLYHRKR